MWEERDTHLVGCNFLTHSHQLFCEVGHVNLRILEFLFLDFKILLLLLYT